MTVGRELDAWSSHEQFTVTKRAAPTPVNPREVAERLKQAGAGVKCSRVLTVEEAQRFSSWERQAKNLNQVRCAQNLSFTSSQVEFWANIYH